MVKSTGLPSKITSFKETQSPASLLGCAAARRLPGRCETGGDFATPQGGGGQENQGTGEKASWAQTKTVQLDYPARVRF